MRVLFLTTPSGNYLEDQILIGLRRILGNSCVDYPRKDIMYNDFSGNSNEIYGNGFTIWELLNPVSIDRTNIVSRIQKNEFDAIIFGSIHRQIGTFNKFRKFNLFENSDSTFIFLDGEDYVANKNFIQKISRRKVRNLRKIYDPVPNKLPYFPITEPIFKKSLAYGPYFKRELTKEIYYNYDHENIFQISYSIPEEKLAETKPEKEKIFPRQVQCEEAYKIKEVSNNSTQKSIFSDENQYYQDLAKSKYGITMKKAGWEAMRHYEIAANYAVPCFYELENIPSMCAPHGLENFVNAIGFRTAQELKKKVEIINHYDSYEYLRDNAYNWAAKNTCRLKANYLLEMSGIDV